MHPGTWVATRWKTTGHVTWVLPSCQHRHDWTRRRNKSDFLTKSDFNKHPHLRATDERYGSHKLSLFRCSNMPGKATGTVHVQTDIRTWARRKLKWTTGGYSALAQVRLGTERKGDSISLFEIWPGIGWRADYAATATMFVMKVPLILEIWW